MTLREFHIALEGYNDRKKESQRFDASMALMIHNAGLPKRNQLKLSQVLKGEGPAFMATNAAQSEAWFENHNSRVTDRRDRRNRNLEAMMRRGAPVSSCGA